ncbi:Proton pump-interactor 1 [Vitis vinifera]|uniref:Proton pump-interactor 1 n=1 Tax=Vitis vinifera TaxID=29760 RepID=A0A438IPN6_VITVI|nr:Proton pump-interactor 1 [Vitis vinifera]
MVAQVYFMDTSLDELPDSEQIPQSYEDLNVKARIEEAEKMIQKWNQDGQQIAEKLRSKMVVEPLIMWDRNSTTFRLEAVKCPDQWLKIRQVLKRKDLEPLQLALDRFCFANKACRGRTNIGSCSSAEGLNPFSFHYKMLHKAKNLGEEKHLLRKIDASQRRDVDSCISVEKLNYRIKMLYNKMEWERNSSEKKQLLRNIKELEVERDKALSNANSHLLGSKEDIQNHIKIISNDLDQIRKEHLPIKAKIKHVEKEMNITEKDVGSLQKKLVAINRKKDKAYSSVLEWKKLLGEAV